MAAPARPDPAQSLHTITVAVQAAAHGRLGSLLSYASAQALCPGQLVRVPLGQRVVLGVVWEAPEPKSEEPGHSPALKPISEVLPLQPLPARWRELVQFAAQYYQRALGEVATAAMPPQLRDLSLLQLQRKAARKPAQPNTQPKTQPNAQATATPAWPTLTPEQSAALGALGSSTKPTLLHGATGSGKTEVYLRLVAQALAATADAQALVMVPEINLTPQLLQRFQDRFAPSFGMHSVVAIHSALTPAQRFDAWLAAHTGTARVIVGTRLAIMGSMPHLKLIVVDEEHDPSYKSQDGMRFSGRDLAVWRGKNEGIPVLLGSATPSLESWHASSEAQGRYMRLAMPTRVGEGRLPALKLLDMTQQTRGTLIAPSLVQAMAERAQRGEQSLLLLNRRGFASVLHCPDCNWKSDCPNCSAYRVFHKSDRSLRCHHCSFTERVPRACPGCGSVDLQMIGKGTEQLEERVEDLLQAECTRLGVAQPLRITRIDADNTRLKGSLEQRLASVHAGEVDVLVGTQLLAKGHDFRRITLVAALVVDQALFSADYRAQERLFSLLMQVAGRAGRDAALAERSELWVQTFAPQHSLFRHLAANDFASFAAQQLAEREQAQLPPFAHQALFRCEAKEQAAALAFLQRASLAAREHDDSGSVMVYPPVPQYPQRVANIERMQMLLESSSRPALQRLLAALRPILPTLNPTRGPERVIRFAVDVDPLSI